MPYSNYPTGFIDGVLIRNMPIIQTNPGRVYWVNNSSTLQVGEKGKSNGNPGTFLAPFETLAYAATKAVSGDIIFIRPGHAENVTNATTSMVFANNGVSVIGLGCGSSRPTITLTTQASSAVVVTGDNISFQNLIFVGNFLNITNAILLSGKEFNVEGCLFKDTSTILNIRFAILSAGGANTVDGLRFVNNEITQLGTGATSSSAISTAGTIDRLIVAKNKITLTAINDKPIIIQVTAGILTNALVVDNFCYRPNTTTAGGSLINLTGTTSTGIVARNYVQTLTTASDLLFTTTVGLGAFENRVSGVVGATGFVIPAVDS